MKTSLRALVALAACATAFTAVAQPQTNVADARQDRQAARIAKGQATGQVSNREAARLNAGQAKVAGMKAGAKADGKVTRAERKAINKEQNKQSRRIAKQKHDGNKK
jgi:uncharacterized membrane protein YebE (DUF533 family)